MLPERYIKKTNKGWKRGSLRISFMGQPLSLRSVESDTAIHISHLSRIFRGQRQPTIVNATVLAGIFGLTIDEFIAELDKTVKNTSQHIV